MLPGPPSAVQFLLPTHPLWLLSMPLPMLPGPPSAVQFLLPTHPLWPPSFFQCLCQCFQVLLQLCNFCFQLILFGLQALEIDGEGLDITQSKVPIFFCLAELHVTEAFLRCLGCCLRQQTLNQLLDELLYFGKWIRCHMHGNDSQSLAVKTASCLL